ncbi:hypothetical protein LPJ53_006361 [Coemansia erecta]|uniref:Uncharacterized protein n=1 Tax=Coemansia erecta TaxID=147472 RepID=A0A9W7XQD9_9FUNG|nr:hypothetical protein LPJ53_006361 [Coemansia erecta]
MSPALAGAVSADCGVVPAINMASGIERATAAERQAKSEAQQTQALNQLLAMYFEAAKHNTSGNGNPAWMPLTPPSTPGGGCSAALYSRESSHHRM